MNRAILMAVVLAGGARFPIAGAVAKSATAAGTSHVVSLPAGIQPGDRLVIVGYTNGASNASASGWTSAVAGNSRTQMLTKIAAGNEGESVTLSTPGEATGIWHAWCVPGGSDVEWSSAAASFDPNSVTPTWGAKKMLVIAFAGTNTATTATGFPSGYSGQEQSASASLTLASCWKQVDAISEDPGSFTFASAGSNPTSRTVAIKGR